MTVEERYRERYKSGDTPWDVGQPDFKIYCRPFLSSERTDRTELTDVYPPFPAYNAIRKQIPFFPDG